ncbi:DUF2235 domain-containing protein [Flavobacterium psychrophilum]|nr:DUF2235 domain-containing protein [Flavobacterium psychrophilum]
MGTIKGDTRPKLGKNTYTLVGVVAKEQHWQLLKNGKQIIDLGGDGGVTFNNASINQDYVIEVNYTDNNNKKFKASLALTPVAGNPNIHLLKWQDDYYEDLNGRFVGYGDKVRLFIHTQNIPAGDSVQVTIWEDQGLDGHSDSSRNMGTYSTRVDKYGKAELYFNNTEVYMKVLNNQDYINEDVHEFYAEVKYMGKMDSIQDTIQLKILNQMRKMIEMPKFNSVVVVDIPDKQKKPVQKTGVKVTVNIFFDGTLNNAKNTEARLAYEKEYKAGQKKQEEDLSKDAKAFKDNDGKNSSYDNYYSNVAIMRMINTVKPENREIKIYIEGEGTENHQSDFFTGKVYGSGQTGIKAKVSKAFPKIKKDIAELVKANIITKEQFVNEIELNVFGFSRGAAAARHFIALKHRLQQEYNLEIGKFYVNFAGLYETVSSYSENISATPNFDNDVKELSLKMEGVQKAVHLTAADEYRANFSLTSIKSTIDAGLGFELELPGVHSDIGGGYAEKEDETRYLEEEIDYKNIKENLINQGWYTKNQIKSLSETKFGEKPNATRIGIPNSYQFIPLAIMVTLAEKYGLKFNKKEFDSGEQLYKVPEDLEEAKKSLVAFALQNDGAVSKKVTIREEYLKPIRNKYLHRSTADSTGLEGRYKDGKPHRGTHEG